MASHTLHFGRIQDGDELLDEVVVGLYRNPSSYTGEDVVEVSCHGSMYIVQRILALYTTKGARLAKPGEFTQRAFLNGKLDLGQAEAVADLIASENSSQHKIALQQMRGGFSAKIKQLRQELIDFAALLELELDFSEEDVEFANREKLFQVLKNTKVVITQLIASFKLGNVIKHGIPVAIVGKPNVGKSTLLNALLQEEKAIVSDIAGTTRDYIEDVLQLEGISYRFIDTAGLRQTKDVLESKGIERSYEKIKQASLILYLNEIGSEVKEIVADYKSLPLHEDQKVIIVLNKSDDEKNLCNAYDIEEAVATLTGKPTLEISAKNNRNIQKLQELIIKTMAIPSLEQDIVVVNGRHVEALHNALQSLEAVEKGLHQKLSGEFISIDMRMALQALGSITGEISNEDVLSSIFSRFCIGK